MRGLKQEEAATPSESGSKIPWRGYISPNKIWSLSSMSPLGHKLARKEGNLVKLKSRQLLLLKLEYRKEINTCGMDV